MIRRQHLHFAAQIVAVVPVLPFAAAVPLAVLLFAALVEEEAVVVADSVFL